jgi:hypothetical protein
MKITPSNKNMIRNAIMKELPLAKKECWSEQRIKKQFEERFRCKVVYRYFDNQVLEPDDQPTVLDEITFSNPEDEMMFVLRYS